MNRGVRTGVFALIAWVAGPGEAHPSTPRSLSEIKRSGHLVVLTRDAPDTHYVSTSGRQVGPEYDLIEAFAESIGVEALFREYHSVGALLRALEQGRGDIAAAGLAVTPSRKRRFRFSPAYDRVIQQVVCRRDAAQPDDLNEFARMSDVRVPAASSHEELLRALERQGYPVPEWQAVEGTTSRDLLRRVWQREIACTVAHSNVVAVSQRYYPELLSPMNLSRERALAWAMPRASTDLDAAVTRWMEDYRASGRLRDVLDRYYGFFESFDYVDAQYLIRRSSNRLPKYREWFREAAERYGLSYTLLAAQGYQESHWRKHARSPTGVRGIMMLTRVTAREMEVEDRLDPRQSIFGGARYMAEMKQRFDHIPEPDRTFLALAAYNVGRAHVHDAQTLAERMGMDPHSWRAVRQVLPLLEKPQYYRTLKYGYAQGSEPVAYVRRIREYHHILANRMKEQPVTQARAITAALP